MAVTASLLFSRALCRSQGLEVRREVFGDWGGAALLSGAAAPLFRVLQ